MRPQSASDAENAIYTLSQLGIDASAHNPRGITSVDLTAFDHIVAMDVSIAKELRAKAGFPIEKLHQWKINDPFGDNLAEYETCAQKILRELKSFVSTIAKQ